MGKIPLASMFLKAHEGIRNLSTGCFATADLTPCSGCFPKN
jgi:hypothetical protein